MQAGAGTWIVVMSETKTAKNLTAQARRALEEAQERRARSKEADQPRELKGPKGPEPTRYGDWEAKGIVSDF